MKKVTKSQQQAFLKDMLSKNEIWALKALKLIYDKQTSAEQDSGYTQVLNGVGFSGAHGEIMSSFAEQLSKRNFLSPKQMAIVFKIIPKYWKQILKISDVEKLNQQIMAIS